MHKVKQPWDQADPNFFTTLKREISLAYPQLHFRLRHGSMFLSGSFPLADGDWEVDRYFIEIEFPPLILKEYPRCMRLEAGYRVQLTAMYIRQRVLPA